MNHLLLSEEQLWSRYYLVLIQIPTASVIYQTHHSVRKANILWIKSTLTPCETEYVHRQAYNSRLICWCMQNIWYGEFVHSAVIFVLVYLERERWYNMKIGPIQENSTCRHLLSVCSGVVYFVAAHLGSYAKSWYRLPSFGLLQYIFFQCSVVSVVAA